MITNIYKIKRYITIRDNTIFAVYCRRAGILYYNLGYDIKGKAPIVIIK